MKESDNPVSLIESAVFRINMQELIELRNKIGTDNGMKIEDIEDSILLLTSLLISHLKRDDSLTRGVLSG